MGPRPRNTRVSAQIVNLKHQTGGQAVDQDPLRQKQDKADHVKRKNVTLQILTEWKPLPHFPRITTINAE